MATILILLQLFLFAIERTSSSNVDELVTANNDFGLKLYGNLAVNPRENIIFSPMSISVAMALVSLGTKGKTLEEIRSVTSVSSISDKNVHKQYQQILDTISKNDGLTQVSVANRMFAKKGFEILSSFQENSKNYYGANLASVDFEKNHETASLINDWVSESTNNEIKDIVSPSDFNSDTRVLIANALYFKAPWTKIFAKSLTKIQNFFITPNQVVQTEFLLDPRSDGNYGVDENLHFEVFEKMFKSKEFSFVVILPDLSKTSLDEVEKKLSANDLKSLKVSPEVVNVSLPKFKIESSVNLATELKKLGIRNMFSNGADFSGLTKSENLYVSNALHKAVVEVNEKGTVAAAATVIQIESRSGMIPTPTVHFKADHPFLFYIKHVETGSILFLGRFCQS